MRRFHVDGCVTTIWPLPGGAGWFGNLWHKGVLYGFFVRHTGVELLDPGSFSFPSPSTTSIPRYTSFPSPSATSIPRYTLAGHIHTSGTQWLTKWLTKTGDLTPVRSQAVGRSKCRPDPRYHAHCLGRGIHSPYGSTGPDHYQYVLSAVLGISYGVVVVENPTKLWKALRLDLPYTHALCSTDGYTILTYTQQAKPDVLQMCMLDNPLM